MMRQLTRFGAAQPTTAERIVITCRTERTCIKILAVRDVGFNSNKCPKKLTIKAARQPDKTSLLG